MVLNKVAVKATLFLFVRRDYVKLKQNNFELYAARYYDNPNCVSREEFLDDLNRFKYIKRLCTKYRENGIIRERLVLNHLVVLYNLFGPHCTEMLYFRLKDENWSVITPFVNALGMLPEIIVELEPPIITSQIVVDSHIKDKLDAWLNSV